MIDQHLIDEFNSLSREMIYDLSKTVTVGLPPLKEECPNCKYVDPDDSSLGTFTDFGSITVFSGTACEYVLSAVPFRRNCPICKSSGVLTCKDEITIPSMINYDPHIGSTKELVDFPGGVSYQSIIKLKVDIKFKPYINKAIYYLVDGIKFSHIKTPYKRGMGKLIGVIEIFIGTNDIGKEVKW